MKPYVIDLADLGMDDVPEVGGKNASLGEMLTHLTQLGVRVPGGYATTASAFDDFLTSNGLGERIQARLADLDVDDVKALAAAGADIRKMIMAEPLPERLHQEVKTAYAKLGSDVAVAVRSSATAEDLPEASFAGQQETLLNVTGIDNVIAAIHEVFSSLFNDRAIAYRTHQNFAHDEVKLSAGIQRMARSDLGSSGVAFTLDTESGFEGVVFVTAAYGLGEMVVQGSVNPDEYYVYKPALKSGHNPVLRRNLGSKAQKMVYGETERIAVIDVPKGDQERFVLTTEDLETLARQAVIIEEHYGRPMDIEWAKDGNDGEIYILQARPETVQSRSAGTIHRFHLKGTSDVVTTGRSIGHRVGSGTARVVRSIDEMDRIQSGDVLVADMTDPDWEPVMKRAAAIVTNRGGRTCHAAIIARELGIPAVVGCTDATYAVQDNAPVTVSCAEGDTGFVYSGLIDFEESVINLDKMPAAPTKIMMNVGNPDRALSFAATPNHGVGLARLEFIINRMIGVHPKALLEYADQDPGTRALIDEQMRGFSDPVDFYIARLAEGIGTIAAAFNPKPVIVRLSDFKSNEYANLIGGERYEPEEENPMLGFRGASRYLAEDFRPCFKLECEAIKRVREQMGLENVWVMVPFVRTVGEARQVVELLAAEGLERGKHDLRVIMMCELPTNALLAEQYLELFDGMSIGSNDMTQLTLGLDRDSAVIAHLFDERDDAVRALLKMAIEACRKQGKYIGICGQGPSDHPDLAEWLVEQGIESVSLNPDTVVETWLRLAGETA